ncbi:hypothetical protein BGZ73_001153 [Actinomortierella ambigua]|nr:hypothetical protein BGZ73_001153 [Actinomortierella ambigua]
MGYQKPYFILYISHSFWLIILPLQVLYTTYCTSEIPLSSTGSFKDRVAYFGDLILQSTNELYRKSDDYMLVATDEHGRTHNSSHPPASSHRRPYSGRPSSVDRASDPAAIAPAPPRLSLSSGVTTATVSAPLSRRQGTVTSRERKVLGWHLFRLALVMTTLYMVPSYLWYACVALTSMANLTAIYNTSCFFAYLFSVLILKDRIVANKVVAVFLSLLGVAIISLLTHQEDSEPSNLDEQQSSPNATGGFSIQMSEVALWGNLLALFGAALYGLEEVIYKKYAVPKSSSITFANTLTGLMGVATLTFFWIPIPLLHFIGIETFQLPTASAFLSILLIATLGLVYNGCFMIVVSQTSPVFAAVGVMATIPLVAVVDLLLFGVPIGWGNIIGGLCIVVGFGILVRENHSQNVQAH